jgi:mono/diheme cytochrome c family protein
MYRRGFLVYAVVTGVNGLLVGSSRPLTAAAPPAAANVAAANQGAGERALLSRYCVTCHNDRLKTAGLVIDPAGTANVPAGAEVWEKVIRKLRTGQMPPPGRPRPDRRQVQALASYLETEIDRDAAARPNPGRTEAIHRPTT